MAHICDECAQKSHISVTSSEPKEYYSPETPKHKSKCHHQCIHTPGNTPTSKRANKVLFCTPRTREKINEIHHYQKHQIDLQRQLHYEQQLTSERLSLLERMASFFCGSNKHGVYEPMPHAPSSFKSPNSWDKNYAQNEGAKEKWSPWKPRITDVKEKSSDHSSSTSH